MAPADRPAMMAAITERRSCRRGAVGGRRRTIHGRNGSVVYAGRAERLRSIDPAALLCVRHVGLNTALTRPGRRADPPLAHDPPTRRKLVEHHLTVRARARAEVRRAGHPRVRELQGSQM